MVAMAKKAWFALMNWKTRMGSLRSPVRTRPLPLPRCRAPGAVADSHAANGSAPRARRWSGRPVAGYHRDRPVVPNSKSPGPSVRTRVTAPPVFAQIGPDQPSVAGIPAHRVGDSSALVAPPSQVERCPSNRVNSIETIILPRGHFGARLTWGELHHLQTLRCEEDCPRVAYVRLAPRLAFVTFRANSSPSAVWRGVELQTGDIVFHSRGERLHRF